MTKSRANLNEPLFYNILPYLPPSEYIHSRVTPIFKNYLPFELNYCPICFPLQPTLLKEKMESILFSTSSPPNPGRQFLPSRPHAHQSKWFWLTIPTFPVCSPLVSWVPLSSSDCLFYASITVLPPLLLTFGIAAHPIPRLSSLSLWCCILHGSREPWVQALDSRKGTQGWGAPSRVRKMPWRRKWQPTAVFLPGESHGQRSLAGN